MIPARKSVPPPGRDSRDGGSSNGSNSSNGSGDTDADDKDADDEDADGDMDDEQDGDQPSGDIMGGDGTATRGVAVAVTMVRARLRQTVFLPRRVTGGDSGDVLDDKLVAGAPETASALEDQGKS